MKLNELCKDIIPTEISDIEVNDITLSSGEVTTGSLFVAIPGTKTDGHNFINEAIQNGAVAIVCECLPEQQQDSVVYLQVESTQQIVGLLASRFFGDPSHKLKVVGVTGTNGKTTTATLLYDLFEKFGYKTGLLSTLGDKVHGKDLDIKHLSPTTQDAIEMQKGFRHMVEAGCEYCFMEVSSHALEQGRVNGVEFTGAIFTNITHEHLDYHQTFEKYMIAKQKLFDMLHPHAWALANIDDENGEFMLQNTKASQHYYGFQQEDGSFSGKVSFEGVLVTNSFDGLVLQVNETKIQSNLIGRFNAYNLLAIFGAARLLDQDADAIAKHMTDLEPASGRFDIIRIGEKIGIVDYAHTPDALENVLSTLCDIKNDEQKIITVIGCGGDRDTTKRPIMARIADQFSDYVVLTSDNPRTEEPLAIINDMKRGLEHEDEERVFEIPDRTEAIDTAVYTARPNDIILVAGKGHEDYQIVGDEKFHFDDREVLIEKLEKYES